jgi:hypothetical protein
MMTARELFRRDKAAEPFSLRALARRYGASTFRETRAGFLLADHHRRTGGRFGLLGAAVGPVRRQQDGSYVRNTQLGRLTLGNDLLEEAASELRIRAEVSLAAVKCFGTEDPGGTDEVYLVISVVTINPNFSREDKLAFTTRTEIADAQAKDVIFQARTLADAHAFPGSGLRIHVAIFEHEHGDADELRDKIQAALDETAKKASSALAGAAAAGDGGLAGAAGDVIDFEVGGIKPFKILTLGLASLVTEALKDDIVSEHEFVIPAEQLVAWAERDEATKRFLKYESSLRTSGDLPATVRFNWPPPNQEFLFSGGGGSYKVYLQVKPILTVEPGPPPLLP